MMSKWRLFRKARTGRKAMTDVYGEHKTMMVFASTICAACVGFIVSANVIPSVPKIIEKEN